MPKVLKATSIQCLQYLKKELSYGVDFLHADKHESLLQVDSIIFNGFSRACPKYPVKFAISLGHLKKEVSNEVRHLTTLSGSNIGLTNNLLYIQCSPTIDPFPVLIWNPYEAYFSFD